MGAQVSFPGRLTWCLGSCKVGRKGREETASSLQRWDGGPRVPEASGCGCLSPCGLLRGGDSRGHPQSRMSSEPRHLWGQFSNQADV